MNDQLEVDFAARDAVLSAHQRKQLCRWLEYQAWRRSQWLGDEPAEQSANSLRRILTEHGIPVKDLRLFGGVFVPSRWQHVGWVHSVGEYSKGGRHGRKIQTFIPKPGVVIQEVSKPF